MLEKVFISFSYMNYIILQFIFKLLTLVPTTLFKQLSLVHNLNQAQSAVSMAEWSKASDSSEKLGCKLMQPYRSECSDPLMRAWVRIPLLTGFFATSTDIKYVFRLLFSSMSVTQSDGYSIGLFTGFS